MENWKDIPGYEGRYQVSDLGRARSLDRRDSAGRKLRGKILKPDFCNKGCGGFSLSEAGVLRRFTAAHLVLLAFVGEAPVPGMFASHKKFGAGNGIDNVVWAAQQDVLLAQRYQGRISKRAREGSPRRIEVTRRELEQAFSEGKTQAGIALELGCSQTSVGRIWRRMQLDPALTFWRFP